MKYFYSVIITLKIKTSAESFDIARAKKIAVLKFPLESWQGTGILHILNALHVWSYNANVAARAPSDFELRRTFLSCRALEHKDTFGGGSELQFCAELSLSCLAYALILHILCAAKYAQISIYVTCTSNNFLSITILS